MYERYVQVAGERYANRFDAPVPKRLIARVPRSEICDLTKLIVFG